MDTTTKFQSKFDLYGILRDYSGVDVKDVEYIVKAVQEHGGLIAEVKRLKTNEEYFNHFVKNNHDILSENSYLKKENESLEVEIEQLKKENEQLKETLKKCNPWRMEAERECPECNYTHGETYCCECGNIPEQDHAEVCQYVKLTK